MLRALALALILLAALPLRAADAPLIEVDFAETQTIPGQPLTLRITVLTPTWLTKPADFPSLETPDLMVRLPERSTGPATRRIKGETWSGVTRRYLLIPLAPRRFSLPPQDIGVIYANPDGGDPIAATLRTEALDFAGIAPEGAEDLDPFIAAQTLTLEQELSGPTEDLAPGATVTRTVTARITGTSAMFLPPLLSPAAIEGLSAYPAAPEVSDETGKTTSGLRREAVTYAAQTGGAGAAPGVSIRWFNLSSGKVETATLDAVPLSVDAPPLEEPTDWAGTAMTAAIALATLLILRQISARVGPALRRRIDEWRARRAASEGHAYELLQAALRARKPGPMRAVLDLWADRRAGPDPREDPAIIAALTAIGAAHYAPAPGDDRKAWADLGQAITACKRKPAAAAAPSLPPLNPIPQGARTV